MLWSSGFTFVALGLPHAQPVTFLALRYLVVVVLLRRENVDNAAAHAAATRWCFMIPLLRAPASPRRDDTGPLRSFSTPQDP